MWTARSLPTRPGGESLPPPCVRFSAMRPLPTLLGAVIALTLTTLALAAVVTRAGQPTAAETLPPQPPQTNQGAAAADEHAAPTQSTPPANGPAGQRIDDPPPAPPGTCPLFRKPPCSKTFNEEAIKDLGLSLREAMHWKALPGERVACELCPRGCVLQKGQRGLCKVRANIDGQLRALTFARPVSITPDPVEKKPLFHVLPGTSTLSIATAGCNSGCVFCQNFEISQALPEEVRRAVVPPEAIVAAALQRGDAAIAYTYTEATVFFEYMFETATLAREKGIRNYWITCGQIRQTPLRQLCTVLDAANVDLKGFSDEFYVTYCDFHLQPVLDTLRTLKEERVFIEITNLLIPGANDDPTLIRDMCRWIVQELGPDTPLHFSRFHPAYKLTKTPATPPATLLQAKRIAEEAGLRYVYIGNVRLPDAGDNICPQCRTHVIRRTGFLVLENALVKGCCRQCGTPIAGIWQ